MIFLTALFARCATFHSADQLTNRVHASATIVGPRLKLCQLATGSSIEYNRFSVSVADSSPMVEEKLWNWFPKAGHINLEPENFMEFINMYLLKIQGSRAGAFRWRFGSSKQTELLIGRHGDGTKHPYQTKSCHQAQQNLRRGQAASGVRHCESSWN